MVIGDNYTYASIRAWLSGGQDKENSCSGGRRSDLTFEEEDQCPKK